MRVEHLTPALEDRGHSRCSAYSRNVGATAPSIPDLLNAATAELSGPTVLHLDEDFDLLAALTQQPTERLDN
ncbi:hypothetical protein [Ornithinimicrobium sp. W1665]|uniref:hypothetical protein n=1 Tax=Ornithinimicrobium sp. W1665 TaxID=3416666 RepID=UPI003CEF1F2C